MRTEVPGYVLEAVIGVGARATVYRARQLRAGGRVVAIKRFRAADADTVAALQRQGEALAELDHPNILRLLEFVPLSDGLAVVLQHAAGGSLADLLARGGPLPAADVAALATPIAEALGSIHRRGLVHGAVKPTNILLTGEGHPLLADFEYVRAGRPLPAGDVAQADPAYAGAGEPGPRWDVQALAAVCCEALTGIAPTIGRSSGDGAGGAGSLPRLAGIARGADAALLDIIARALSGSAEMRHPDGDALATALRAASGQLPVALAPTDAAAGAAASPPPAPAACDDGGPADPQGPETREFGPRPPRPDAGAPERPPLPWLRVAAVAAFLLVAPPLAVTLGSGLADATEPAAPAAVAAPGAGAGARAEPASPPRAAGGRCAGAPAAEQTDPAWLLTAPDRCEAVRWADGVLEVTDARGAARRYALGAQGDQILVGDWSCDGVATPSLYRPATGQVFVFARWPDAAEGEIAGRATQGGPTGGRAVIDQGSDGCDRVSVLAG